MAYRFFTISVRDEGPAAADLNGFLRSRRVLSVDRRWVDEGSESFWSFCVDYLESSGGATGGAPPGRNGTNRGKVDYREVLSPEDFAVFARLRQARKEIAQADAVPVYTIFTNEQLAQMVQARATTKAVLEQVAGVGDARIEKYGARMLEVLKQQWDGGSPGEAGGTPFCLALVSWCARTGGRRPFWEGATAPVCSWLHTNWRAPPR